MALKQIATTLVAAAVATQAAGPARADFGDAVAGGIVGGIISGVIINEGNKQKKRTYVPRSSVSSSQREANREVQVALNYFGFPVGTPDGALGPRSRAAIGEYQATLGYAPTGQLTDYERSLLISSYHRAVAGGPMTAQLAAQNPLGMRGLVAMYRDESMGVNAPTAMPPAPAMPAPGTTMVVAPEAAPEAPALPVLAAEPAAPAAPAAPGLPSFIGNSTQTVSLASHCNSVSLQTSTSGGFVTVANMTDPVRVLDEQFCLARTYAIAEGEQAAAKVQGFTPQQIAEQCAGFGPATRDYVAALSLKPASEVMTEVQQFALSSGMAPQQLAATARICLSVGYRTDDMGVALGSALILASLGEGAYAELPAYHLAQGFGAQKRPDLALGWYDAAFDALGRGAPAVFAPGQPERTELLRKAAYAVGGKADQASLPQAVPATLPGFAAPAAPAPADSAALAPAVPAPAAAAPVVAEASAPAPQGASAGSILPMAAKLPTLLFGN